MNFPDAEALVIAFLTSRVDAPIYTAVPESRPSRFVRLWRNGGASTSRIVDRPQVTIEAWSLDSVDAAEITNTCRAALLGDYVAMPLVRGVYEVSGPYAVPDDASESPRYRFTVALTVRATR